MTTPYASLRSAYWEGANSERVRIRFNSVMSLHLPIQHQLRNTICARYTCAACPSSFHAQRYFWNPKTHTYDLSNLMTLQFHLENMCFTFSSNCGCCECISVRKVPLTALESTLWLFFIRPLSMVGAWSAFHFFFSRSRCRRLSLPNTTQHSRTQVITSSRFRGQFLFSCFCCPLCAVTAHTQQQPAAEELSILLWLFTLMRES